VRSHLLNRVQQQWLISVLLVALAVRALIPAGFMPSADQPFTLQICPDGFPAQFLHRAETGIPSSEHGTHADKSHADESLVDESMGPQASGAMHVGLATLDQHAAHHAHGGSTGADAAQSGHGSHEHGGAVRAEHCVFAAVASVAPPPQFALLLTPFVGQAVQHLDSDLPLIELTRYRVQQPRGPPHLS
jgi:hypothetical protein